MRCRYHDGTRRPALHPVGDAPSGIWHQSSRRMRRDRQRRPAFCRCWAIPAAGYCPRRHLTGSAALHLPPWLVPSSSVSTPWSVSSFLSDARSVSDTAKGQKSARHADRPRFLSGQMALHYPIQADMRRTRIVGVPSTWSYRLYLPIGRRMRCPACCHACYDQ
jgi:hypothetical protein